MCNIAERTMLLRGHAALPTGLALETEEFQNSWSFVLSGDTSWLDNELRARGWHFIRIAKGLVNGGVGQTSQKAIASALERALRHVNERFNAAEVGFVSVKQYPWFFSVQVKIYPYQIQQGATLTSVDEAASESLSVSAEMAATRGNQVMPAVS